MASQPTPPNAPLPKEGVNKALLRETGKPLKKALISWGSAFGEGLVD